MDHCQLTRIRRYRSAIEGELLPALPQDVTPPAERWTPTREPRTESDLLVPAGQAVLSAMFAMIAVVAIGLGLRYRHVWEAAGVVFGATLLLAWFWRLGIATRLLWISESLTRRDLSGDGFVGKPQIRYTLLNPGQARQDLATTRRQDQQQQHLAELTAFVRRCATVGTSESAQGIAAGDRADYVQHRDLLLSLGLAEWRNPERPKAGWALTTTPDQAERVITRHVLTL